VRHSHANATTAEQPALPFSLYSDQALNDPCSPEALKAAYTAAGIWRWCTFEEALASPSIRICLRNAAQAAARNCHRHKTPRKKP
jgi:hypothetical protein